MAGTSHARRRSLTGVIAVLVVAFVVVLTGVRGDGYPPRGRRTVRTVEFALSSWVVWAIAIGVVAVAAGLIAWLR